jgi:hypothetical protein
MLESLHNYLVRELEDCNRRENSLITWASLVFIGSIFINIMTGTTGSNNSLSTVTFIFSVFMTAAIDTVFIIGIWLNYKRNVQINDALLKIYTDKKVDKYIRKVIPANTYRRSLISIFIIIAYAIIAIVIPILSAIISHNVYNNYG